MTRTLVALAIAGSVSLGGCAALGGRPAEEIVAERSQQRLDLLMNGGWKKAYEYASPNYRATEPVAMYSSRYGGAGMWLEATVDKVTCDGEKPTRCEVLTTIKYEPRGMGFVMPRVLEETWIYTQGNWYKFEE
jgi:hypothetical protein